jgi:hypothetical protein
VREKGSEGGHPPGNIGWVGGKVRVEGRREDEAGERR